MKESRAELYEMEKFLREGDDQEIVAACKMCLKEAAKYTCPRCNVGYCSLQCYQSEKHAGCSEAFYKECVVKELSDLTNDPEDQQRVLDMLAKDLEERAEEDAGEGSDDDLAERLEGLDLDRDISKVWARLKPKEKEDFARMLQDGRLSRLIELWTPWWRRRENQKLVVESGSRTGKEENQMPEIKEGIPDINILLKNNRPSSECKYDLLNVLYSYAFVSRVHNGCHMECPLDSAQDVVSTCYILRDQNRCGSVGEAIQMAFEDVRCKGQKSEPWPLSFTLTVLEDVKHLVSGPGQANSLLFISASLSDLVHLFEVAFSVIKKELKDRRKHGEDESDLSKTKSVLFKAEKKLTFLLSWCQRYGMSAHQLLPQLQFEIETRQSEDEQVKEVKSAVESNMDRLKPGETTLQQTQHKPKIVELN